MILKNKAMLISQGHSFSVPRVHCLRHQGDGVLDSAVPDHRVSREWLALRLPPDKRARRGGHAQNVSQRSLWPRPSTLRNIWYKR